MCGFLCKCGYKESELIYQRKQFYSLNMKSGETSDCEQTGGNKNKENVMCFSS